MFRTIFKIIPLSGLIVLLISCKEERKAPVVQVIDKPDTTITQENAYVNLFLDSAYVQAYSASNRLNETDSLELSSFYNSRNYQYAWFDSTGITENARLFINRLEAYNADVPVDTIEVLPVVDSMRKIYISDSSYARPDTPSQLLLEVSLTHQFFRFVHKAYGANDSLDMKELGWFIPAKKINAAEVLDSVLNVRDQDLRKYLPIHPMYEQLRKYLQQYLAIQKAGNWDTLQIAAKKLTVKDSGQQVFILKQKLYWMGDLTVEPVDSLLDDSTMLALKSFNARLGFTADTFASSKTIAALNRPIDEYVRQLYINLERARWIPKPGDGRYIMVNIPAFMLYAFDSGKVQLNMGVVVGKPATNTVIFNGNMSVVAFSPYWNVPYSIVKNEMGRTAAYFSKRNMEIVGRYSDGLPMVRERPGPSNSLGKVKFLFPNSYNIYLHDTPAKSLFGANQRAFSHGCIRVSNPPKLAYWVMSKNENWDKERIDSAMNGRNEMQVKVNGPIPVFIGYFTAFVSEDGKLNLRDDIYGHDAKLEEKLFAKELVAAN